MEVRKQTRIEASNDLDIYTNQLLGFPATTNRIFYNDYDMEKAATLLLELIKTTPLYLQTAKQMQ